MTADDAQCVLNVDGTEETIPLSRIKGKATKEQYNKYIQTLKLKNPKSLKFFAGEKTPLPPDTLVSGEVIPWISFGKIIKNKNKERRKKKKNLTFFDLSFLFKQFFMMEIRNLLKSQFWIV